MFKSYGGFEVLSIILWIPFSLVIDLYVSAGRSVR